MLVMFPLHNLQCQYYCFWIQNSIAAIFSKSSVWHDYKGNTICNEIIHSWCKSDSSQMRFSTSLRGDGSSREIWPILLPALWVNGFEFHFLRCHSRAWNLWMCWLKPNLKSTKIRAKASESDWDEKIHYWSWGDVTLYVVCGKGQARA